ncbi:MAG: hypothetical protein U1G08_01550 [Verrucomicrobiota bacterium]
MKIPRQSATTRRDFLSGVSRATVLAAVGSRLASDLGISPAFAGETPVPLHFGPLEPLVCLMQETPPERLLPLLTARIQSGTDLRQLTAAAALANARTFGGEDYVGFHTMMALAPAYHMSRELPGHQQALPVLKVLYRNTRRIQEHGGRSGEVLHGVAPGDPVSPGSARTDLRKAVRDRNTDRAEQILASRAGAGPGALLDQILPTVEENSEVHRVVMPYRAWDLMELIGTEHALTLLRQSVRYCIAAEASRQPGWDDAGILLTRLLDQYRLMDHTPVARTADDAWVGALSQTIFSSTGDQAAEAAADALSQGFPPSAVGEAISLAANQLILRDHGRTPRDEVAGKPMGSVHGDSIGVHACDSANAWRNLSRIGGDRNSIACLILGARQVAIDRTQRGGDFLHWDPLPVKWQLDRIRSNDPAELLQETEEAIRGNLQAHAAALVYRYGELGHAPRPVFDLMLRYAVSEDGSLHAEKYYRTVSEEFATTRDAFRWRQLIALARVTASEYGRPAPGMAEAQELLRSVKS